MSREGRTGGRRGRAAANAAEATPRKAYIERNIPPYSVLGDADLAILEYNADTILEETGIDFREDPESMELFAPPAATSDGERVHFPRGLAARSCRPARRASSRSMRAIPAHNVVIGGKNTVFAPAYGSPFVRELRGPPLRDDRGLPNFVKLAYMAEACTTPAARSASRSTCR
jgi:trimethylamine--corrinoid protein Co-methyltransferase